MPRTELLNTRRPKNKPWLKKLNGEWIQAQQIGENRTSKERAGWKTAQQKKKKTKSHTQKRERSPYMRKSSHTKQ